MDEFSYYPPVAFKFLVAIDEVHGIKEGNFQEVAGLSFKLETEDVQEGGENRFIRKFPKPPKFPNLVLKRGMLVNSPLVDWFYTSIGNFKFSPRTILIILLNQSQLPVMGWNVINAMPVGLSLSDLKSEENKIMIETLELAYDYFEEIDL